jgi:hypothetical protein
MELRADVQRKFRLLAIHKKVSDYLAIKQLPSEPRGGREALLQGSPLRKQVPNRTLRRKEKICCLEASLSLSALRLAACRQPDPGVDDFVRHIQSHQRDDKTDHCYELCTKSIKAQLLILGSQACRCGKYHEE